MALYNWTIKAKWLKHVYERALIYYVVWNENNCSFTFYTYFEIINEFTLAARSDKRPNIYIGDIYMFLYLNRRRRQFDIKNVPKNKFREKSDIIQESINYYIYFSL